MKHRELTGKIIGACYTVADELGHGFVESVYHQALMIALAQRQLTAQKEVPLKVHFQGQVVGEFAADIIVNGLVLVEVKAVKALRGEHQAQVINYLNATEVEIGLLVNFDTPRPEIKRCVRRGMQPTWSDAHVPERPAWRGTEQN